MQVARSPEKLSGDGMFGTLSSNTPCNGHGFCHRFGDSSASLGVMHRVGRGRMKHWEVEQLWVKGRNSSTRSRNASTRQCSHRFTHNRTHTRHIIHLGTPHVPRNKADSLEIVFATWLSFLFSLHLLMGNHGQPTSNAGLGFCGACGHQDNSQLCVLCHDPAEGGGELQGLRQADGSGSANTSVRTEAAQRRREPPVRWMDDDSAQKLQESWREATSKQRGRVCHIEAESERIRHLLDDDNLPREVLAHTQSLFRAELLRTQGLFHQLFGLSDALYSDEVAVAKRYLRTMDEIELARRRGLNHSLRLEGDVLFDIYGVIKESGTPSPAGLAHTQFTEGCEKLVPQVDGWETHSVPESCLSELRSDETEERHRMRTLIKRNFASNAMRRKQVREAELAKCEDRLMLAAENCRDKLAVRAFRARRVATPVAATSEVSF